MKVNTIVEFIPVNVSLVAQVVNAQIRLEDAADVIQEQLECGKVVDDTVVKGVREARDLINNLYSAIMDDEYDDTALDRPEPEPIIPHEWEDDEDDE